MSVQFRPEVSTIPAQLQATQAGKTEKTETNTTSSLSSSESKGFFGTIFGGVACAAFLGNLKK